MRAGGASTDLRAGGDRVQAVDAGRAGPDGPEKTVPNGAEGLEGKWGDGKTMTGTNLTAPGSGRSSRSAGCSFFGAVAERCWWLDLSLQPQLQTF